MPHLKLDQSLVDEARVIALHIGEPVIDFISKHTTVAIERTTLRLIGVDGVDEEEVVMDASITDDLGADSLDQVELVMALETEFNLDIPDEAAEKIKTVGDAVRFIEEAGEKA